MVTYLKQSSSSVHELDVNMTIDDLELGKEERRVRIPFGQVAKYYAGNERISVLELNSGEKIYATMPFNDLLKRLEQSSIRRSVLDLRDVTGITAHQSACDKRLKEVFSLEANNPKIAHDDMLIIMYGYNNESCTKTHKRIAFLKSDILKISHTSEQTFLRLNEWSKYRTECGMTTAHGPFINITKEELEKRLEEASSYETRILDLSKATTPQKVTHTSTEMKSSPKVKLLYNL